LYPARFPSASVLALHEIVMVVPPMIFGGTVMLLGVEGAVLVEILPSSETKREEGSIKAGRIPREFGQPSLPQSPKESTIKASREPLLEWQYGERSHQKVAEPFRFATRLL